MIGALYIASYMGTLRPPGPLAFPAIVTLIAAGACLVLHAKMVRS